MLYRNEGLIASNVHLRGAKKLFSARYTISILDTWHRSSIGCGDSTSGCFSIDSGTGISRKTDEAETNLVFNYHISLAF